MGEVKAISFVFENCESVEIPIDYVYTFNVNGITKSRSYYPHGQGLHEHTVANKLYVSFVTLFEEYKGETTCGIPVKERLEKYNDICWFDIVYDDGTSDSYQIAWTNDEDDHQYSNKGQKVTTDFYGQLLIEVGYE